MKGSKTRLALVVLLAAALSAPYLLKDFWFDEIWTMKLFVARGFFGVFTDYRQPNNHILFSATLCLWEKVCLWLVLPEKSLRLLPWLCSVGSVALLYVSIERWRGSAAATWAAVLVGTSNFFLYYACQLRGYPLSFFEYALGLHIGLKILSKPSPLRFAGFNLVALAAVGTVPTNLPPFFCLSLWLVWELHHLGRLQSWAERILAAMMALAPVAGMVWYFWHPVVRYQFLWHAMAAHSFREKAQLFMDVVYRAGSDWLCLAPLAIIGLWLSRDPRSRAECRQPWSVHRFLVLALLPLAGGVFLAYYPRNFSPLMVFWSAALGILVHEACEGICSRFPKLRWFPAVFLAGLIVVAGVREISLLAQYGKHFPAWNDPAKVLNWVSSGLGN